MKEGIYTADGQPDIEIIDGGNTPDGKQLPWVTWRMMPQWEDDNPELCKHLWYAVEEMIAAGKYEPRSSLGEQT